MCRKLIYLFTFVLVLAVVNDASADLVGYWKFDEGSGDIAVDLSGYGNDGTINGATWTTGKFGPALNFDGVDDDVDCGNDESLNITGEITIALWMKPSVAGEGGSNVGPVCKAEAGVDPWSWQLRYNAPGGGNYMGFQFNGDPEGSTWISVQQNLLPGEWYHIAGIFDGANMICYLNGVETERNTISGIRGGSGRFFIGQDGWDNIFNGVVDELRIYNHALSAVELLGAMAGEVWPYALGPKPEDGALYPDTWVNLSWLPGGFAVSHDVYLGDNFDDVDAGAEGTFQGNQAGTFIVVGFPGFPYPDGLVPGTTYYWRIDEVNDAEPNSPWKGDVWSFSVPPKTAYSPNPAEGAESIDVDVTLSWTGGFGSKLHTVYFGDNFDEVNNAAGGLPQGTATYTPTGPLKLAKTYYWRVDEFDVIETHKGDVWSFTTQGAVGSPDPSNGAVDVKHTPILTWTPGVYAASHQVYFGNDQEAVRNANTGSPEYKGTGDLGSESYEPGKLEWNTTYYWRIDEANNTNPDSPWTGNLWSFTTANFLIVDDFDDYDVGNNEIWWAWIDGLGYASHPTLPAHPGNGTGSMVGDETTGSYMEETIVHGGGKSMPVFYDNNQQGKLRYSEVEMTLSYPRDWTENGVSTLSIWFRGISDNAAETLYVALNSSAVVNHDNPNAAQIDRWTEWTIDLQAFADQGVNLANVNTIALGLGNKKSPVAGGSGTMYFDDIRLYPPAP
jgi:hypothetical protein